jgi:hypothetical protein
MKRCSTHLLLPVGHSDIFLYVKKWSRKVEAREKGEVLELPPVWLLDEINPYMRKALDTRIRKGIRMTASVK